MSPSADPVDWTHYAYRKDLKKNSNGCNGCTGLYSLRGDLCWGRDPALVGCGDADRECRPCMTNKTGHFGFTLAEREDVGTDCSAGVF